MFKALVYFSKEKEKRQATIIMCCKDKEKHMKPLIIATLAIHCCGIVCQCLAHINDNGLWDTKNSVVGRVLLIGANIVSLALFTLLLICLLCRPKKKIKERLALVIGLSFAFIIFYMLIFAAFFVGLCHDKTPWPLVMIYISWFIANVVVILIFVLLMFVQELEGYGISKAEPPKSTVMKSSIKKSKNTGT